MPFALDLIKSSLEAGHTLLRALQVVVGEFADPLGSEFRTVLEQVRLGLPLTRAMEDMLQRVPEEDLRLLLVAVKVQTEVGSSLAVIVSRLSEVIRTRQRLKLQIKTLTAQSRMGGMVVGCLPIVVLFAFYFIQPTYTHVLVLRSHRAEDSQVCDRARRNGLHHDPQTRPDQVLTGEFLAGELQTDPLFITVAFGFLIGAAGIGLYVAVFGTRRVLEDRLADLAVKMRLSQGDLDGDRLTTLSAACCCSGPCAICRHPIPIRPRAKRWCSRWCRPDISSRPRRRSSR